MHFLSTGAIQEIYSFTQLSTTHDGVVNEKQFLIYNNFRNRNLLHFCNKVTHFLVGRSKGTRPSRSIFNERTSKRFTGFMSITNRMGYAGIRNTCNIVNIRNSAHQLFIPSHDFAILTTHYFNTNTFIVGVRITIVSPHKCADFHFIARLR